MLRHSTILIEANGHTEGCTALSSPKTEGTGRQLQRQHGHHTLRQIQTGGSTSGFLIKGGVNVDQTAGISDVDPDPIDAITTLQRERVINFSSARIVQAVGGQVSEVDALLIPRSLFIRQSNKTIRFLHQIRGKTAGPDAAPQANGLIGIEQPTHDQPLPKIGGI